MTGRTFGRLTVLNYAGKQSWNCRCECGSIKVVLAWSLTNPKGGTRSCGCLARDRVREANAQRKGVPTGRTGHKNGKFIDLTGKIFGRLTVVGYAGKSKWNCRCECGKSAVVGSAQLTRADVRSCGCLAREPRRRANLLGRTFGQLTVMSYAFTKGPIKGPHAFWNCQCACGVTVTVPGRKLVAGTVRSCGCIEPLRISGKKGAAIQRRNVLAFGAAVGRALGEKNSHAKLTANDVRAIREEYAKGRISQERLGKRYGVSQQSIYAIVRFRAWRHVG